MQHKAHLLDWRLHLFVIIVSVVSEYIGIAKLSIGVGTLVLLPLLYAFVFALLLNPNIVPLAGRFMREEHCSVATYAVMLSVMPFIAKFGVGVGPKASEIIAAGPALLLQELGNVATAIFALPVAVLLFRMGREAVGATHSIAREPNIALIADKYGLKSPEGIGVMGVYVMGTLFGAIFFSFLAGVVASWNIFDLRALAMACGIGSGSMMGACSATLSELMPERTGEIAAFAASSNLLTYATGLFVSVFIALPITNFLFHFLHKLRHGGDAAVFTVSNKDAASIEEKKTLPTGQSLVLLALICVVLLVSNWVGQGHNPIVALPGMLVLYACCVSGIFIRRWLNFGGIPAIAWVSVVAIVISLPEFPFSKYILQSTDKLGVLQLITPVLAYAGFAISGLEVDLFKKAGIKLIVIALLSFTGTFLGSAVIANLLL